MPLQDQGNPTKSIPVQEYIRFIREEQGCLGIAANSAKTLEKEKMDLLIRNRIYHSKKLKGILRVLILRRTGIYCYCFIATRRINNTGHLVASNVVRLLNNNRFAFECTWDKTLRMGSHVYRIKCTKYSDTWCYHCIIDWYVEGLKETK